MNYYEVITHMDKETLAKFIMYLEHGMNNIPKLYSCGESYCVNCKNDLYCYKKYLEREVEER